MKRPVYFFYLILLVLFLSAQDVSRLNLAAPFQRRPIYEDKEVYTCLSKALPQEAHILFFSQPDGTLDFDKYTEEYISAQYELVPRVLAAFKAGPIKSEEFRWWIAIDLPTQDLTSLMTGKPLEIVQTCGRAVLLGRAP